MPRYDPQRIEPKWQRSWEEQRTFATPDVPPPAASSKRPDKLYVLDMFPYPSRDGLHDGHPEGYTATDIVCRYSRMRGRPVLHPMGWDAFGLPAEQHAAKTGTHPRITTDRNIETFQITTGSDGPGKARARRIRISDRELVDTTTSLADVRRDGDAPAIVDDVVFVGRPVNGQQNSKVGLFKVVEGGKYAVRTTVSLGRSSVNTIEVVDGLVPGEQVILSDMAAWDGYDRIELE